MMKIYNKILASIFLLSLLFTSCSKEENNGNISNDSEMANLSFSTILHDFNNLRSQQKDHVADFPICSDAAPAYVTIVLTGDAYDGPESLDVPLTDTPGDYDDDGEAEYFTLEDDNLELPAGLYILHQFTVYDENDNLIWVAPTTDGSLGSYVDSPLPKNINLVAGTKKYVDVEVLCYDKRMVNEYGYLFFELETNLALDFCFFANYCDENGRHFTADYYVNIWYGTDDSGTPLYSGVGPTPAQYEESGEYYTEPVCFALPELPEGLDAEDPYIYFEATLSDWDDNYGDVDPLMISGTLSYSDITANFDGDEAVDFRHLRFGCGDNGGEVGCDLDDPEADCDNDGVLNGVDCDPDNASIDTTNENDADCDGVLTEDDCDDNDDQVGAASTTYYADNEGDGLGDPDDSIVACSQPEGYVDNNLDQCPEVNPDTDTNGDGCEDVEECDNTDPEADCDEDGILNKCDTDSPNYNTFDCDGDEVLNEQDGCPRIAPIIDLDKDGCEDIPDECDNTDPEADCDEDGILNKCDTDSPNYNTFDCDGDGEFNGEDNCPTESNPNQADIDEDGIGDICDPEVPCTIVETTADATINVSEGGGIPPTVLLGALGDGVVVISSTSNQDIYIVDISLDDQFTSTDNIEEYQLSLSQGSIRLDFGPVNVDADSISFEINLGDFDITAAINVDAYIIYCEQ